LPETTAIGDLATKIVLGTVQLGLPYGRHRSSPLMSEAEAFRILDEAVSIGIRAFDTAESYGVSAARLRAWSDERGNADLLEVITKCSVDSPRLSARTLEENADKALARFDGIGSRTVLSHGAVGPDLWPGLLAASVRHNAKAGQSVYSSVEVRTACDLPDIERVQAPGNVLDKRAIRARGARAVPLDLRSVYLQGVLLEDPTSAEIRAPGSGKYSAVAQKTAAALDTEVAPLLIASMLKIMAPRDRLVVGVDDIAELEALPKAFELNAGTVEQFRNEIERVTDDAALDVVLDPRRWPQPAIE
jgi:aryl-alcohol dehydrogenase-like predicted oxidoreductase